MALGAKMSDVLKLVLRNGMSLVLIGTAVGLGGAYAITRVMSNLLFEVAPTDLATFAAVPAILFVVALMACLVPANSTTHHKVTSKEPVRALVIWAPGGEEKRITERWEKK